MRNLQSYYQECREMLDIINVPYGRIKEVVVNGRANSRWGCCKRSGQGYVIEINPVLLSEKVEETALYNMLMHEILHTVDFNDGHGRVWKSWARKVNREYGLDIKRCDGDKDSTAKKMLENRRIIKYVIGCPCCGKRYEYQKRSQAVQHPEHYRCGKCGSTLELIQG